MTTPSKPRTDGTRPPWPDGNPDAIPAGSPRGWKRARLATDGQVHTAALYSDEAADLWSVTDAAFCHMGGDPFEPGHLAHCKCGLRVWDSRAKLDRDLSCGIYATILPVAVLCAVAWQPPSVSEERCRRVARAELLGVSVRNYCMHCARRGVRGFVNGRALGRHTYEMWTSCETCADDTWITVDDAAESLGVPIRVDPWLP